MACLTSSEFPSSEEPVEIEYKRYRNKRKGYTVEVTGVTHRRGTFGYHTTVHVRQPKGKACSWPAKTFLRTFEPVGRKIQLRTIRDRVMRRDKF